MAFSGSSSSSQEQPNNNSNAPSPPRSFSFGGPPAPPQEHRAPPPGGFEFGPPSSQETIDAWNRLIGGSQQRTQEQRAPPTGGFTFGGDPPPQEQRAPPTGGFTFGGLPPQEQRAPPTSPFTFGGTPQEVLDRELARTKALQERQMAEQQRNRRLSSLVDGIPNLPPQSYTRTNACEEPVPDDQVLRRTQRVSSKRKPSGCLRATRAKRANGIKTETALISQLIFDSKSALSPKEQADLLEEAHISIIADEDLDLNPYESIYKHLAPLIKKLSDKVANLEGGGDNNKKAAEDYEGA